MDAITPLGSAAPSLHLREREVGEIDLLDLSWRESGQRPHRLLLRHLGARHGDGFLAVLGFAAVLCLFIDAGSEPLHFRECALLHSSEEAE